ncbi:protein of unknown function [Candidatus Nitrospira inopinata]|uniref:Uncharacterized protein n=1 Tax=Candidatus Nitrospira inopinata TaxID=1715989 RepID=A0A0S4KPJ2_9BACT|nr:protein of unknown function [Candidatus Nitrospira inopinata]
MIDGRRGLRRSKQNVSDSSLEGTCMLEEATEVPRGALAMLRSPSLYCVSAGAKAG